MDLGEPKREIEITPREDPVPRRERREQQEPAPVEPERVKEPART